MQFFHQKFNLVQKLLSTYQCLKIITIISVYEHPSFVDLSVFIGLGIHQFGCF